jgi:hypothetical protein
MAPSGKDDSMKNLVCTATVALALVACDIKTAKPPQPPPPPVKPPVMEAPKPVMAPPPAATKPPAEAPKKIGGEAVGKTSVAAVFACPKEGCSVTFPSKGACLKHADTQMKEQWFTCAKDSVKEPVAGKCPKCGTDLSRILQ